MLSYTEWQALHDVIFEMDLKLNRRCLRREVSLKGRFMLQVERVPLTNARLNTFNIFEFLMINVPRVKYTPKFYENDPVEGHRHFFKKN